MPSIRELRDQKQRESFTGREAELDLFRQLLETSHAEHAILHLYGVGGMGKSSLLRQFRRLAEERDCPTALVDLQVHFGVIDLLRAVRLQIGARAPRDCFAEFDKALELYNDVRSKLQEAAGSLTSGVISGLREGVPLGLGALAVDALGEEQVKAWLYRHLPRANAELYLRSDGILTERLVSGLNRLAEDGPHRLVLLLDTYEQASQAQDDWLRDILLESELSDRMLIVSAGRDPLGGRWHEWRSVALERELHPFTEEEARAYLERRGVADPEQRETVLALTGCLPWALALATDAPLAGVAGLNPHQIGEKLVERFLSQLDEEPDLRELVEVCAVLRTFDHDVVRAVWGGREVEQTMRRLRRYSFVLVRPDGRWSLHQVVRQFLDQSLRGRSSERWSELNRRAAAFYSAQAPRWPRYSPEWTWLTLENLFHRLRLDEDEGMSTLAALFEEAQHVYRRDFCSELLNNVLDVPLQKTASRHWISYYQAVMTSMQATFAWAQVHAVHEKLYQEPDLPPRLRARVTTELGRYAYQVSGEPARAVSFLEESLALRRELGDQGGAAHVLSHLAVALSATGQLERARQHAAQCLTLAEELKLPARIGWALFSLGQVETRARASDTARRHLEQALHVFEENGHEYEAGVVHYHLGRLLAESGDVTGALAHHDQHLRLMLRYEKLPLAARALVEICELMFQRGEGALAARVAQAERMILTQRNHAQLARLRLVQAAIVIREASAPGDAEEDAALRRTLSLWLRQALAAAGQLPGVALGPTRAGVVQLLDQLRQGGRKALADLLQAELGAT
jgi:tetratricopeptide (TPR) repeat protein